MYLNYGNYQLFCFLLSFCFEQEYRRQHGYPWCLYGFNVSDCARGAILNNTSTSICITIIWFCESFKNISQPLLA
ncbi:hypothetical protein XELAEV_18033461mg [Xenopus laevis]|uniref:Uncharacterized protein n=1 Tax=Xenopus laevis TaxID=8355 RepID=A0A974CJM4_XENLA|nr:hypothetical protein XELAEV_18033461mg [Xenopus laevis]